MKEITGLIAAPFTAFTADGEVDLGKVAQQKKYYKRNGISGVFVCGTTGEGSSLTMDEKKALFREWAKYRDDGFAVIGFVGGTSVKDGRELAGLASECGLDAIAMTAPYYQKAANVHELALTLAEVAAAAPSLPFFYYHIPSLTNVCHAMIDLLREMDAIIPNLAGIKYTYENMMDYQLCLEFKERKYNIMWGRDEMLLPALSLGATTFVGSTYGYSASVYAQIIEAFRSGDIEKAAGLQYRANILITFLGKYGNGAGKAFMKAADMDLGPCRRPLSSLSSTQYEAFLKDIKSAGFDEFKCKI